MCTKYKQGEINKDDLIDFNNVFREKPSKPEEINSDNLEDTLAFLNENTLEHYLEERALLNKRAEDGDRAIKELKRRDFLSRRKKIENKKKLAKTIYFIELSIICLFLILIFSYLIFAIVEDSDTTLGIISAIVSIGILVTSLIKRASLQKRLKKRMHIRYLKHIQLIN